MTTFEARFDSAYDLIRLLRESGVDEPIFVVINGNFPAGSHSPNVRGDFLRRVVALDAVNPICLGSGRGLAYVLNAALKLTHANYVAVFADDCNFPSKEVKGVVSDLFEDLRSADLVILNNDMGNFGVSRKCLMEVGWFNELLVGIGWEDTDFIWRTRMRGSQAVVFRTDSRVQNTGSQVGFENVVGEKVGSKYSLVNRIFMRELLWDFNRSGKSAGEPGKLGLSFPSSSEPKRRKRASLNPMPLEGFAEEVWNLNSEQDNARILSELKKVFKRIRSRSVWL